MRKNLLQSILQIKLPLLKPTSSFQEVLSGQFKVFGKGRKERFVFINKRAQLYIRQYVSFRWVKSDLLFTSERAPYSQIKTRAIDTVFNKIRKRCNVYLYPHVLRHTFATRALGNGAPLLIVQKWLDHASAATTEIYAKNSAETIGNEYRRCVDF